MGRFYIFERRVPILTPEQLARLSSLGAQVSGGSGKVHIHIFLPEEAGEKVIDYLESEGFRLMSEEEHGPRALNE
ncbi:MAG: hypothetical protein ACE5JJ_01955 [Nitrospinota bacterium]